MRIRNLIVLCFAVVLFAGCATGKDEKAEGVVTVGKPYAVRKLVLPEQKTEPFPFSVRKKEDWECFTEKDLAPVEAVKDYLEAIASSGRLPLRVKEGFLVKERKRWHLVDGTLEEFYGPRCFGFYRYYIVDMGTVR